MDRRIVLVGGAVVAAAAIVLAIKLRGATDALPGSRGPAPEPTIIEQGTPSRAGQGGTPSSSETVSETVTEPARVRDHRTGDRVAYDPDARTGEKRTAQRLPADLVHTLSKQLEAAMVECTTRVAADARGPKPGVTGAVFVDVADGSLQVSETAIELRDLLGDAAVTAKECIQARWVGQTTPAPGAVATTHYEISVVFAVPSR